MANQFHRIFFRESFIGIPILLAEAQTTDGTNTANLRWDSKDFYGVNLRIAEETSLDPETYHFPEIVGYMVFSSVDINADTDGDALLDMEEVWFYKTNRYVADTDGDGLNDGDELDFWQGAWDVDYDADGLANLLDADSDGDGYLDGEEIAAGSDPSDPYSVPAAATWTDYRVLFTMGSNDNDAVGLMFRYQDPNNYYRFSWDNQRYYRRLVKCEDGVFTLLAEDSVRYVTGETYEVEVVAEGTTLEVFVDDELIFSVVDDTFSSGTIGLYSWANQGSVFDNVLVENLSTGAFLLQEDFGDGDFTSWSVVDEGTISAPSTWSAETGAMKQNSNIYSAPTDRADLSKLGTFVVFSY